MSDEISWCVELAVKPGRLETFKELTAEMVLATREERGALAYQRFATADGRIVHALERYADSDAAAAHLEIFRDKFGARFSALVERRRFTVYGTPSAALKTLLDGYGAIYLECFGGLGYWPERPAN